MTPPLEIRTRRPAPELIARVLDLVGDLDELQKHLEPDPATRLLDIIEGVPLDSKLDAGAVPSSPPSLFARDNTVARVAERVQSALGKIQRDGTKADLDDEEYIVVDAIVATARPALLVTDGHFQSPAPPWKKLEAHRPAIETALQSVGRIELTGHPISDIAGTGFLVAHDIVMTNRHVAKEFLRGPPWEFEPGITARIDFNERAEGDAPREHAITSVIAVSLDVDLALVRVDPGSAGGRLPPPLRLAAEMTAAPDSDVYVIGYPIYSGPSDGNSRAVEQVFGTTFGVKRLQPGKVLSRDAAHRQFLHDCSTLHCNSGSCVIDLSTGSVVGLHYRGRHGEANFAVALADCKDDPLVKESGLQFM